MKARIFFTIALSCCALSTSAKTPIKTDSTNDSIEPVDSTICAETSDGNRKTFKTKCAMNTFNCKEGTNYSYVMDGPCCAVRCMDVYEPICAEDSKGFKRTFTSHCQLSGFICNKGIDFTYVNDGPCCAINCAQIYKPICAVNSDGEKKTFGSPCDLSSFICSHGTDYTYLMDGACPKDCDFACLDIYKPVCAINTKGVKNTFSNSCEMGRFNCVNDDDFKADDNTSCLNDEKV